MAYEMYGPGVTSIVNVAGAPVAGTNEVQTATFGGTWVNGELYRLSLDGRRTATIAWNSTNATLLSALQTALDAIGGTNWVVATAGTLTAGIGTVLLTFSGGDFAHKAMNTMLVNSNASVSGTLAIAETTPGVDATRRDSALGALLNDVTNKKLYTNTSSTVGAPTWTVVGSQS